MNDKLTLEKVRKYAAVAIGFGGALFHIYNLGFSSMNMWSYRMLHVSIIMAMLFLLRPILKNEKHGALDFAINLVLIGLIVWINAYTMINRSRMEMFMTFSPEPMDVIAGCITILLVLEMTRRINGLAMPILASVFLLYTLFGNHLSGLVSHNGYSINRIATFLFSPDGIFGTSIGVSATFVALFIIFGSVMEGTGGGVLFINSAVFGLGRMRGGPAKAAVASSALMGMISGSSAANVVTTGSFTIPLMKKVGYRKEFAGAVEAVASTGGQIMPPIMGAGAFLMAEALGVPYLQIAKAAVIPALIYFMSVFVMVDLEAKKTDLRGMSKSELPDMKKTFIDYGLLVIPLIILIYLLTVERTSAIKAGLYSIYASLIIALIKKSTRYDLKKFILILSDGMKSCISVVAACACAGIIVGVLTLTGLGSKLVVLLVSWAGGNILLALFLVMIVTLILGMGLPTTAAYIVCSAIVIPVLVKIGLPTLPSHFFVFYFACLSAVTPPVAIAAYAAAGVSGGDVNETGWKAFQLALAAFIVPYMFIYSNSLLMIGSFALIIRATITAMFGTYIFAHSISGWFLHRANWWIRGLLLASSLLMIDEGFYTDFIGLGVVLACVMLQKFLFKNDGNGVKREDAEKTETMEEKNNTVSDTV